MALPINNNATARIRIITDAVIEEWHSIRAVLQFAAVGRVVYEKAKEAKLGMHIKMEWFQPDSRN